MTMFEMLNRNGGELTDHDVAVLSDWASEQQRDTPNKDWKRAYALLREGADLLLRRRARSRVVGVAWDLEPEQLNHQNCASPEVVTHA